MSADVIVAFAGVFVGAVVTYALVARIERGRLMRAARRREELAVARREGAAEALRSTADEVTPTERRQS